MQIRKSIALLLFIYSAASLYAQRLSEGAAPPPVVAQSVVVRPGETVVVPLGIHGVRGEQLEFLIRSLPRFGKLSAVRATGVNSAQVSYTAPLGGAEEDRFTYAVRGREGMSAPGMVSISIPVVPAQPARLVAPEEVDLPKVFPGQRATADVELRNTGGTALEGAASVPAPWSIEGEKRYRIGPGERMVLKIAFVAEKAGTFKTDIALGPDQRRDVAVKCEVEDALLVSQTSLLLRSVPDDRSRKAVLQISNRSEEEIAVVATTDARLSADKIFPVPARGKVDVPVAADEAVEVAFDGRMILQTKAWRVEIPVHVEARKPVAEPLPQPASVVEKRPPPIAHETSAPGDITHEDPALPLGDAPAPARPPSQYKAADMPNMLGRFARATSPTSAKIEWPVKLAPAAGLRFQMRELSLDNADQLQVTWRDLPLAGIKESVGNVRAEITNIEPAQLHTLRAVRGTETVFTVQFFTPPKKPFVVIEWKSVCVALLILILGWIGWRKWKARARSGW